MSDSHLSSTGRPKVACLVDHLDHGGDSSHLLTLLRFGLSSSAETHVVSIAPVGESAFDFQKAGAAVHALDLPDPGGFRSGFWSTVAGVRTMVLLKQLSPRIVICLGERAQALGPLAARMAQVPWVAAIVRRPSRASALRSWSARLSSSWVDHWLVTGESASEETVRRLGVHPQRIRRGGEALDLGHFAGGRPLDLPKGNPHLGLVLRLVPDKCVPMMFDAAEILLRYHPEMRVTIVGGGPSGLNWLRETQRRGLDQSVHLRGPEEHLPEFLAALDLFVMPAPHCGQSRAVLEAMAAKVPVVAAASPWLAETFRHEQDLLFFDPTRAASLADAVDRVVREPGLRARLVQSAFARVVEEHRAMPVVARTLEALPLRDVITV